MILTGNVVAQDRALEPQDVIEFPAITQVQLSPNGRQVVYALRQRDIHGNGDANSFWLWTAGRRTEPVPIDERASHLRWRPDGRAISYLAPDSGGVAQVWEYGITSGPRSLTAHPRSILSYEWSPDNRHLAFSTSRVIVNHEVTDQAGIIIDIDRFSYPRLLANKPLRQRDSHSGDPPTRTELAIYDVKDGRARLVSDSLSVGAYAWSPDGRMLAMSTRGPLRRVPWDHLTRRDLMLYSLDDGSLDLLEAGSGGDHYDDTVLYDQPFWSPDGTRIGYFRSDLRDRWAGSPQLGIYSLVEQRTVFFLHDDELETYKPRAIWLHPDTILLENTYRAGRRLFSVTPADSTVTPVIDSDDWFDLHSFSSDGGLVAFIRERIDQPAELFVSDRGMREPLQLTELSDRLEGVMRPRIERVSWRGEGGVDVEGWLYLPPGEPPFPTLVFIHGGPTFVFGNRYEPYLNSWPHGFGLYAARGMAVFAPNYRATGSYGKAFRQVSALDAEPITDIIAGLDMLVGRGVADPDRLGIAGHSNGCWLGALVAVRHRRFAAAACAEGAANRAASYQRNPGWINSESVEYYWGDGASPYANPERYREMSPVYGFDGLQTPFLFEAGELTHALSGLEFATAAWRAGVPHELVIYRETHHNIFEPRVMLEALERNLDWFAFWLLGHRQPENDAKRAQYERWRALNERWQTMSEDVR